jgi:mono/diheme cytochrome c family protein
MASHIAEETKRTTRRTRTVVAWSLGLLIVLFAAAITGTVGWRPFLGPRARPLTTARFAPTPERRVRGEYLVEHVTPCMDCHAPHRWTESNAPIPPNMAGAGQEIPMKGLPGRVVAPNISPDPETGMGTWSDDQLARAIREGIGHDGRALFPIMPYQRFRSLSDEDLASIIVYLRALPPVRQPQPATQLVVPVRYLIRSLPEPLHAPVPTPDQSTPVKRGAYLATIAACADCHTPQDDRGQPLPGLDFAGGFVFDGPWGRVASANLTPDPSGIPYYNAELFTEVLRTGHVKARALNQFMPWNAYGGMTDDDIAAIFAYLTTLKPVVHRVTNDPNEPLTLCRLCGHTHGYGDRN